RRKRNRREQADFTELTRRLVQQDPSHGAVSQKVLHAEETILASLLKNPDYLKKIGERLEAEDFSTEFGRKAYSIIAGRLREGKGAESFILSQYFDPEEMGQLARIQNAGVPFSGTLSELEDCIAVLKHREDRKASGGEDISDEELRGLFSKG
ncbi:MAG: hypothetical protein IJ547_06290, partial [Clostridia bacterium]|nr:hypothetical protein [Clostridia bacterium]